MDKVKFDRLSSTAYDVNTEGANWGKVILLDLSGYWSFVPNAMINLPHWLIKAVDKKLDGLNNYG